MTSELSDYADLGNQVKFTGHRMDHSAEQTAAKRRDRTDTRFDHAHALRHASAEPYPSGHDPAAVVGADPAQDFVRQVHTQASQLAAHLQAQQLDLDHRQSEVNARVAAIENEIRTAQIWLSERRQELDEDRARLAEKENLLDRRLHDLGIVTRDGVTQAVETELSRRAEAVRQREAEIALAAAELSQKQNAYEQQGTQLDVRRRYLSNLETMLEKEQRDLAESLQQFEAERTQWEQRVREQREQLTEKNGRSEELRVRRSAALQRRAAKLEQRERAVQCLRDKMAQAEREVLEARVAAEQVWSQVTDTVGQQAAEKTLAQARAQLANHFGLTKTELVEEREKLERLATRILNEHEALEQQRASLREWVTQQQQRLTEQAEDLEARQRQFARRNAEQDDLRLRWQQERAGYQQEIRKLLARLHGDAPLQ